jgi:hypothetical protein
MQANDLIVVFFEVSRDGVLVSEPAVPMSNIQICPITALRKGLYSANSGHFLEMYLRPIAAFRDRQLPAKSSHSDLRHGTSTSGINLQRTKLEKSVILKGCSTVM